MDGIEIQLNQKLNFIFSFSIDLTTRITFWNITINTFLMWICHVTFSQNCVQRIASVATLRAAKRLKKKKNSHFFFQIS